MTASEGPPEYRWCQAHPGLAGSLSGGQGRNTVPARSAISGTVLAVVMVGATLTFGSSLSTLVSHPPLYGWNWSYALSTVQGKVVAGQLF